MNDLKSGISPTLARKIFGNAERAKEYLSRLDKVQRVPSLKYRTLSRGESKGKTVLSLSNEDIWKAVVDSWDYNVGKQIVRDMFKGTDKYKSGKEANDVMEVLIGEWQSLNLGEISWPFSQGAFDTFVQRINSETKDGTVKDDEVKTAAVKYRRIKEINTVRNDFIETLVFEKNDEILPTLNHQRGVDFFINGISFDQKVAKSPTNEFKTHFKDKWREEAIKNPGLVAEYLYKHQDEGRFGADSRLLVVYIDEDVSIGRIGEIMDNTDLTKPIAVNFTYDHQTTDKKNYQVSCFVILLHN